MKHLLNNESDTPNVLRIVLIRPSKYDDDGYVNHHCWGVLPSNTLSTLNALFRRESTLLGITTEISVLDESVGLVIPEKVVSASDIHPNRTIVGLVGVQTNQFPRATDLASRFRALGAMVVIGGFHVSGTISMIGTTPELQQLMDQGVSLFIGEAEGRLEELLRDALKGELKLMYRAHGYPALDQDWPLPRVEASLSKRFMLPFVGTVDASRGCIFQCSFCTIINVQGKTIRSRDPERIERHIRSEYPRVRYYFFTDDNMARNRKWRDLFERLIRMRKEGIEFAFMMQVDTAAHKLPDFVEMAAQAGCSQVFIGIESLNQENLKAAKKNQNQVDRFNGMADKWHAHGIAVHAAYIIGFPHDTPATVREDIRTLMDEVRPDQASFFMLTPLPGSADHAQLLQRNEWMSPDFNEFDSFHATARHPLMTAEEWFAVYQEAWETFYASENLIKILSRVPAPLYWNIFKNAAWYRYAALCEGQHPMITGFLRLKGRTERRSGFPIESRVRYLCRRTKDWARLGTRMVKLVFELERIWRKTWLRKHLDEAFKTNILGNRVRGEIASYSLQRFVSGISETVLASHQFAKRCAEASRRLPNRAVAQCAAVGALALCCGTKILEITAWPWLFLLNYSLET